MVLFKSGGRDTTLAEITKDKNTGTSRIWTTTTCAHWTKIMSESNLLLALYLSCRGNIAQRTSRKCGPGGVLQQQWILAEIGQINLMSARFLSVRQVGLHTPLSVPVRRKAA